MGFFSDWPKEVGAPWFLLFDGLDEVPTDQRSALVGRLSSILKTVKQSGNRVALTSRPGDFSIQLESKLTSYTLLGFTSQQQKQFADDCFGTDGEEFLRQTRDLGADDFGGNPLLFTIAAVVFRHDRDLKSKASLYERFIQIWLDEATERGLKSDLGGDLYVLVQSVLEEMAFQMTQQPGEGSPVVLSRRVASYLKDKLGVPIPKAFAQGKILVDVLGVRSGVFARTGNVCNWAHANFREYLAGRSLDTQLLESGNDYGKVLGDRPFDSNWVEVISTLVQVNDKSSDILNWMAEQAVSKEDVQRSLLVYYYWTVSRNQGDPEAGQQRWAFSVLAQHDPDKLFRQAIRLYDENGLENSARSRLVVLLARLIRSGTFNFSLLLPLLKRLLCDEELWMRESVAEDLIYLTPAQQWQVYTELSSMGNDWAQACGVYSLAFWDSDESEIERLRYSAIRIVRFFADRALTIRRKRTHLRQLADSFIGTGGVAGVSSYLALIQEGGEQDLHYIDDKLESESIAAMFLPHMQSEVQSLAKKRREGLTKKEQELFCNSSRHVVFNDMN